MENYGYWQLAGTASIAFSYYCWHCKYPGWPLSKQCEIPWRFSALLRGTRHVKSYSYHACTSVTVSGGSKNATVHDL